MAHNKHHAGKKMALHTALSDSDSDSDSCSSGEYMLKKKHTSASVVAAAAPATSAKAAVATANANPKRVIAVAPAKKANDPADAVRNFVGDTAATAAASPLLTVTAKLNLRTNYSELQKTADGGQTLRIDTKSGLLTDSHIHYSHPIQSNDTETGVDYPVAARGELDHTAGVPLLMRTPIRALKSETEFVYPNSATAENPNGFIALKFQPGSSTASWKRNITPGVKAFIAEYPGQTAEGADAWVSEVGNKPNLRLLQVVPESAVAHFYNSKIEDPEKHATAAKADEHGFVYVDKTDALAALADTKRAIEGSISYTNLSDKKNIVFDVAVEPRLEFRANGPAQSTSVKLSESYKALPMYTAAVVKSSTAAGVTSKRGATDLNALIHDQGGITFTGAVAIDFYHVDKNFKLADD